MEPNEKTTDLPPEGQPPSDAASVEPWRAELGDLRSSVQRMETLHAEKDREIAYLKGRLEAQAKPAPQEDDLADIPDDEFLKAVDEGDTGKLVAAIRRQAEVIAKREVRNLRANDVNPLRDRLENFGMPILSEHSRVLASSKMPHLAVPEVAQAMEGYLANMAPEQKATEAGLMIAYKLAKGDHTEAIIEYERKKTERSALNDLSDGGGRVTNTRGRNVTGPYIPTPGDLGGQDAERAAAARGGHDALAQKMGYADWQDYMKQTGMVEG